MARWLVARFPGGEMTGYRSMFSGMLGDSCLISFVDIDFL